MTPTPPSNTATQMGVILERLEGLRGDVSDLSSQIKCIDKKQTEFIRDYTSAHAEVATIAKAAAEITKDHEERIRELENIIKPMALYYKIQMAIGLAVLSIFIAFLWSIFTHQVTIVPMP